MLVDTSVLVADAVDDHPHHDMAAAVLDTLGRRVIAAHSLAELYNTLSKPRGYGWPARDAARATDALSRRFEVVSIGAADQLRGIVRFASAGGVGAKVYDFLIGYHAVVHAIDTIVTLNDRDFRPLFPHLTILTPAQYLETL